MRISDWSSDVCSSDLRARRQRRHQRARTRERGEAAARDGRSGAVAIGFHLFGTHAVSPWGSSGKLRKTGATSLVIPVPSRDRDRRSEEHTSELQSLMRISYAVFCLKKKNKHRS